jgi:hypothetical protein
MNISILIYIYIYVYIYILLYIYAGLKSIGMQAFEYAKDKIMMGAERKSAVLSKETMKMTAFHEAGTSTTNSTRFTPNIYIHICIHICIYMYIYHDQVMH